MGWIDTTQLKARAEQFGKNGYGEYLSGLRR
jgi:dTDP-glucose pyrophosphorylase